MMPSPWSSRECNVGVLVVVQFGVDVGVRVGVRVCGVGVLARQCETTNSWIEIPSSQ